MADFGFGSFLWRWVVAVILVLATYNPTGWCYYSWVVENGQGSLPLKMLAGLVLVIGFVVLLRASLRSLGALGILLTAALLAVIAWLMADLRWIDLGNRQILAWVVLFVVATILAVGVSWSHLRRRISGQLDMDDLDEP